MPVVVEVLPADQYAAWADAQKRVGRRRGRSGQGLDPKELYHSRGGVLHGELRRWPPGHRQRRSAGSSRRSTDRRSPPGR